MRKTLFALTLLLTATNANAQYGYDYCSSDRRTLAMGDSLLLYLDADTLPDARLVTYVDPAYGKTARLLSLRPNYGSTYLDDVKFKGGAVNNAISYPNNAVLDYTLSGSEAYTTGPYVFRESIGSYFNPGDSGYVCYSHGSYSVHYDPSVGNDTFYHPCMGWIRLGIGGNLDSVTVEATCGCDPGGITAGLASTYVSGIGTVTVAPLGFRYDNGMMVFTADTDSRLRFELYDLIGQKLAQGNIGKGVTLCDTSPFPSGLMIVGIFNDAGSLVRTYKVCR